MPQSRQLALDKATVLDLRRHGIPGCAVGFGCLIFFTLRRQNVATTVLYQGGKFGRHSGRQCLGRIVIGFGVHLHTGQAQAGNRYQFRILAFIHSPLQRSFGLIRFLLLDGHPCCQQSTLHGKGGASVVLLEVRKSPCSLVELTVAHGTVEFFIQASRSQAALLLPVLVAVPGSIGTENQHEHPGDQVAVLLPEVLELIQLFLLFVVVGRHVCRNEGL